jgi:hypothetical protein
VAEPAGTAPRIFSEAEIRHLLSLEVRRSTRYQDFLSVWLIRAIYPGGPLRDLEAAVARRIAEILRATDIVGIVGSEILVLLVHTPDVDSAQIVDRIRDQVEGEAFELAPSPGRISLRIGRASFPTDATSDEGLLSHAQTRLQTALPRSP